MTTSSKAVAALAGPVLVIGASGFVGSNLLRNLLRVREDIIGTSFSGSSWRLAGVPTVNQAFFNIQDPASIYTTFNRLKPRTIFDCSAFGAYSFETDHERIHATNYASFVRLLEFLTDRDISAYIHAGSSSEYGLNAAGPAEDAQLLPNSHYAVSKAAAAQAIMYYGRTRGLPVANLRLYSVYGPYEDSSRLIPTLCQYAQKNAFPPFASAGTARDFIHIDDVSDAFIAAALAMDTGIAGESFNIGTGVQTTLSSLAHMVAELFAIEEEPSFTASMLRLWDMDAWYAAPAKAERLLGWKARIPLKEGLQQTYDWWRETLNHADAAKLTKKEQPQRRKNSVSAIIACYRDGQAIPIMYERLTSVFQKLGMEYEIIFVNDNSPDDSEEVIREISAQDPHVIGISHSRNFGSQAAFRSGMELASKEAVVLLDGDLQDPPELIKEFVEKWHAGADIVFGCRVKREMPKLLEWCYKAFYRLFDMMSDIPMPRNAGDFSLIDRSAVYWLLQCGERDYFLRGLRSYVGFKQVGVDYMRPERMFGKSTNNWIKNIGWAKKAIFSFSRLPLHLLTAFGGICLTGTVLASLLFVLIRLITPESIPKGVTTMMLLIMFFGSATVLGIGILGEYIGKILEEAKGRPPFIRKHIISRGVRMKEQKMIKLEP